MPTPSSSPKPFRSMLAGGILLLGFLVTVIASLVARATQVSRARARFEAASFEARGRLENRLRNCEDLLLGIRGFAQAQEGPDRMRLRTYLQSLDLGHRYPGLLGASYGVPVPLAERGVVLERLRREHGQPGLEIKPGWGFELDAIVLFAEPEATNLKVLGFNSGSSPEQRNSLLAARDTGQLQASPAMPIAQAPEAGPGLVLRLAVYLGGRVPPTLEGRRAAFAGYANCAFLLRELADDSLVRLARDEIRVSLTDITESAAPATFLEAGGDRSPRWWHRFGPGPLRKVEALEVDGRQWAMEFQSGPAFFQVGEVAFPWLIFLLGVQTTLLLAALVRSISLTGQRARKLAEEMTAELHRSESRLRAITRVMPDAILVLDADGRYVEILTSDDAQLAAPPSKLLGRTVDDFLEPELVKAVHRTIRQALAERQIQSLEYALDTGKGHLRFEARVAPMDVEIEGRPCVIWVARDVTERHAQEEALLQTQKLESLGLLAGGIAHDFNNLLAAIQGHLNLAQLVIEEQADPSEHFIRMNTSIRRAADLARQLLAYSGRGAFQVELVDLNILVGEMAELLAVSRSKKVELAIHLRPALPPIQGDRVQLQQVVMNLVMNASEAFNGQAGVVELATGAEFLDDSMLDQKMLGEDLQPGEYVTLLVHDQGCGMEPEVLARIFDPFFTTKPMGRGLGLSAMRGILRAHRAGIEIHSQPGRGTRIKLYFPISPAGAEGLEATEAPEAGGTALSGTILLAEDESILREIAREMVERLGFSVVEASDGEEAWEHFRREPSRFRAVVLDLTMPRRGGLEVYALIRDQAPALPIVLCSGYSREEIPEPRDSEEPRVFLQKPFTFRQFEAALREVLGLQS